jgi:hydrogenase-4 component B
LRALPSLAPGQFQGRYAPLGLVVFLLVGGALLWLIARLVGGEVRTRVAPPWVCGFALEPRMQYTATGFAKPIRLIFQATIRPERNVILERPASPFVVNAVHYEEGLLPVFERHLYERGVKLLLHVSQRIRLLQSGSLRAYLSYLFVTLVVVLALTR